MKKNNTNPMFGKWTLYLIALVVIAAGIWLGNKAYGIIYKDVNQDELALYVDEEMTVETLIDSLESKSSMFESASFRSLCTLMKFEDSSLKTGKYRIPQGSSNRDIISTLKAGLQSPVNVVIHQEQNIAELAGKVSRYLAVDSQYLVEQFRDTQFLQSHNLDSTTLIASIIPNTYQMWWNSTPDDFIERMKSESEKFWQREEREQKANALGMSQKEVYALASIVEKESRVKSERSRIAGVYLNRLERGIALQADPTVLFALQDFSRYRVLKKDLEVDSPYNTYKYPGLPPGPIGLSSISSIDAVLNAEKHQYLYFCAKPDNSGRHVFARTLGAHLRNAERFQSWLNQRRIYR